MYGTGYCGEYILEDYLISIGAGVALGLGSLLLTYSVMVGNSGVSFALTMIQVLVMADNHIDGSDVMAMAVLVVSLVLCVFGLIFAIFGDRICKWVNCRMNYTFNEKPAMLNMPF